MVVYTLQLKDCATPEVVHLFPLNTIQLKDYKKEGRTFGSILPELLNQLPEIKII